MKRSDRDEPGELDLQPPRDDSIEVRLAQAEAAAGIFGGERAPVRIGRFELTRRIGAGGFGTVYAARDPALEREVAVKVLHPGGPAGDRLVAEARAMARLSHPNVVAVHEVGVADGRAFVVMELVAGTTLRAWTAGERPWRDVLRAFRGAGAGLAAAHAAGITHRDFKPDNVFVGEDGRVRVGDFGMAGGIDGAPRVDGGTPLYMAPEQHAGKPVTAAADQFAFCAALHEALYRRRPFAGSTVEELAANKGLGELAGPSGHTDAPGWLWPVLRRGMASDPARRWPSMQRLLAELERSPRHRAVRLLAIALVAAVLGVALLGAIMQIWMMIDWRAGR
ncbi:MAG TPA: serine/threonine-protein kinase [Kofleriaceae bacterium]|nr:serine/threonine-protein kinase [Kofleriaceae bacterium]